GQPFQRSLHHNKYLEEQDKKKQQEEIKQQEQLKAKQERERQERLIKELDEKVNKKIEDLKLNYPDEWEAVEKEVSDKANAELQPPKQDKEEREFIKAIISELTEHDKNMLEAAAIEKAKTNLIDLGFSEDSKNFNNVLKSVKQTTFELIVKDKYSSEIQILLKETKYYKAYEQRLIIQSNRIRREIIIKNYLNL
ncbi:MAG: hypothetical protein HQK65_18725, partial [Desulfamplus sp.]|nr:hypothetical protein [Desulfamplus sp.]